MRTEAKQVLTMPNAADILVKKNNAGKAVFLPRSLRQEKACLQGYNKRLQKIFPLRVVFFQPPLQAPPPHLPFVRQPTSLGAHGSAAACFSSQAFTQSSFAATLAPCYPNKVFASHIFATLGIVKTNFASALAKRKNSLRS